MCSSSHGEVGSHCLPFRHPCHLLCCLWLPRHQVFSVLCTIKEALVPVLWGEDAGGVMLSAKLSAVPLKRGINLGCIWSESALYSVPQINDSSFFTYVLLSSALIERKERTLPWACILHGFHILPVAVILKGCCIPLTFSDGFNCMLWFTSDRTRVWLWICDLLILICVYQCIIGRLLLLSWFYEWRVTVSIQLWIATCTSSL